MCSVFVDRLQPARRHANTDELLDFGYPDTVLVQVRVKFPPHIFRHVPPDATLFLGHTTAMDNAAARDARPGNAANLRHRRSRATGPECVGRNLRSQPVLVKWFFGINRYEAAHIACDNVAAVCQAPDLPQGDSHNPPTASAFLPAWFRGQLSRPV